MTLDYQRILVAIDWNPASEEVLKVSAAYAREHNLQLDILHVIDSSLLSFGNVDITPSNQKLYVLEQENMNKLEKRMSIELKNGSSEYQTHIHLRFGDPRKVISTDFPSEYRNDLIILGTTQKNRVQRTFVGSVSNYVVKTAKCDVLVVR
ncbi:universal stress protein [Liquorilactobacillus aquaticus]|uniref:universal stress protein n=1 Tax=Liquorilactobacillus aquaticus TaxID=392566 RepID=UPI001F380E59|nr:universal stress protein [Liquorilactobacillus aquaticus]